MGTLFALGLTCLVIAAVTFGLFAILEDQAFIGKGAFEVGSMTSAIVALLGIILLVVWLIWVIWALVAMIPSLPNT